MIFNKNLAIVVPTYNRVKILKIWLEHHAQLMFLKKIQIHIQDNQSTDGTKQLIKEWKKKFKNISFETNKKNIGIKNLEKSLNKVNSRFVWMVGDTYFISNQLINKILLKIKAHSHTNRIQKDNIVYIISHLPFEVNLFEFLSVLRRLLPALRRGMDRKTDGRY
jgi:glycosyltransferase involved in cell wall biosynthesis